MALSESFLNTCRDAIADLTELTTFRTSLAAALSGTRTSRISAWHATYKPGLDGTSPAQNLRKAIRGVVGAQADLSGALGILDRESAVRTLVAEFAPTHSKPPSDGEESAALEEILRLERLS